MRKRKENKEFLKEVPKGVVSSERPNGTFQKTFCPFEKVSVVLLVYRELANATNGNRR